MQVTKTVQNSPPLAWTRACSRESHWWIVSSMTLCSRLSHTSIKRCFRSSMSPNKRGTASYPTTWGQQCWGRGYWEVADWQQWKPEPLDTVMRNANVSRAWWVHCPAKKWSPVSATRHDNAFHLFWCQGRRIWGVVKIASFSYPTITEFAFICLQNNKISNLDFTR